MHEVQLVTPKSCLSQDSVVCIIVTTWLPNPRRLNLLISILKVQGKDLPKTVPRHSASLCRSPNVASGLRLISELSVRSRNVLRKRCTFNFGEAQDIFKVAGQTQLLTLTFYSGTTNIIGVFRQNNQPCLSGFSSPIRAWTRFCA